MHRRYCRRWAHVATGTLKGVQDGAVRSFKGIPYAAPPTGERRWTPPQPASHWKGSRDAVRFGPPCAQLDVTRINQGTRFSGEGIDVFMNVPMSPTASEDCLTLNVWTPVAAKRLPVMVFTYGGGGSTDVPLWDGTAFARDGVVLVSFNYRNLTMGKFGHPALSKAASSKTPMDRYDLMDAIAALKWVKQNIAAFGGDAGNVTLFGQSAGGAATLQLLTAPAARGLFHKAIVESGNGWWTPATHGENERIGSLLASRAGLPGASASLEQLRALAPDAMPWIGHFVYDGRLLPESPTAVFAAGHATDVPLMIGWNSFDGSSLRFSAASVVERSSDAVKQAYKMEGVVGDDLGYSMYTDSHVGAPARWIAKQMAAGAPSYLYHYSYVRPADRGKVRGASHGAELPFVFDSWSKVAPELRLSDEERSVTH
jgi:para-nitrobenzyl esterase